VALNPWNTTLKIDYVGTVSSFEGRKLPLADLHLPFAETSGMTSERGTRHFT